MPEYINPQKRSLDLLGPDGRKITIRPGGRITLPKFFDRYLSPGMLRRAPTVVQPRTTQQTKINPQDLAKIRSIRRQPPTIRTSKARIVGQHNGVSVTTNVDPSSFPISNGIGVAVLSYNRALSLARLLNSIIANTDLNRTTVFICDDCSDQPDMLELLDKIEKQSGFVVVRGGSRLGVAGNMNRAFRCLSRFNNKIILNDDVEILRKGWDDFYFDAMSATGFHHFCYREPGIYGAKRGEHVAVRDIRLEVVYDKPQGAVLAIDNAAFSAVGYCDESLGLYGMEHVDWSARVFDSGLQPNGFYDVDGSNQYFRLYNETSALANRVEHYNESKRRLSERKAIVGYVSPSDASAVPTITCVIPMRDAERRDALYVVLDNVRAQRFPAIEIIVVEQDTDQRFKASEFSPAKYIFVKSDNRQAFNKSRAFNAGVAQASNQILVLHDADTLAPGGYFAAVYCQLQKHESCHFGERIHYTNKQTATDIVASKHVPTELSCDVSVTYFEGGSLGCWFDVYWRVGGFVEAYSGYGCFLPGVQVLTEYGYKPIEQVTTERLYTHEGRFQSAIPRSRSYNGEVLDIFIPGRLPIKGVTPEHPFLVQTGDDEFMWRKACELGRGDIIAATDFLPEPVPSYDLDDLRVLSKSQNTFDIHQRMEEFCYLLGLYLADGVIQTPDRLRILYYYLDQGEEFLAKHVEQVVHSLHPNISVNYDYIKNGCREVRVFNSLLAKLIYAVAGKFKACDKTCSQAFLSARSDRELSFLLGGASDGDANHSNGSEKRIVLHSSSYNLAATYSAIMRRLGIAHSFGKRNGGSFEGSAEWTYDLTVNREFEHLIRSVYPKPPILGPNSFGRSRFGTVYNINRRHYDGLVYNFEVEEDHSYVVHGLICHNCEDCDFYARLSGGSRWCELRNTTFIHLWHGRSDTWRKDHEANKLLEKQLKSLSIVDRISSAKAALRQGPYKRFIIDA